MSSPTRVSPTPSKSSLRSNESPVTTGRGPAVEREPALEREALLPPLNREILGSLSLAGPRPSEDPLPRPADDLEVLLLAVGFAAFLEAGLEAVFDRRAGLLFFFAVDLVDWRAIT